MQTSLARSKEQVDRLTSEKEEINMHKLTIDEGSKRLQKQLREMREELGDTQKREMEAAQRKKELVWSRDVFLS